METIACKKSSSVIEPEFATSGDEKKSRHWLLLLRIQLEARKYKDSDVLRICTYGYDRT